MFTNEEALKLTPQTPQRSTTPSSLSKPTNTTPRSPHTPQTRTTPRSTHSPSKPTNTTPRSTQMLSSITESPTSKYQKRSRGPPFEPHTVSTPELIKKIKKRKALNLRS
eukprot:GHVP01054398.1.p1 GENE.GHVP01054398.1~~GHVP01054398.1.p1  ORF type:complete len:109 (-),score=17.63 GHVP01054398.1:80-406(-)